MPGKAYTMKEMKKIVDFLVENKLYSETKGRKMWMDMEKFKIVDRSWQSMKETFIKRIFHELSNPYYNLTVEQIASFRQGFDVSAKTNNKLEIQTISDDSNSNSADNQNSKAIVENGKNENCKKKTEDKTTNAVRSSTETLVLDNCYETADDVLRDLESPKTEDQAPKTLRDLITYTEPLTPMLQEVIHDFSTDDEEPRMQIVEEVEEVSDVSSTPKPDSPETIRESQSFQKVTGKPTKSEEQPSKIKSLKLKKTRKGTWENKETTPNGETSNIKDKETNNNESNAVFTCENKSVANTSTDGAVKGNSSESQPLTNDTHLPNNQEGLADKSDKRTSTESMSNFLEPRKTKDKKSRKRSRSRSAHSVDKKKERSSKDADVSEKQDTQTFDSHPHAYDEKTANKSANETNNVTDEKSADDNQAEHQDKDVSKDKNEGTSQEAGPSYIANTVDEDINPCLKSVNLFAEQFTQIQNLSDHEEESKITDKVENTKDKIKQNKIKTNTESKDKAGKSNNTKTVSNSESEKVILLNSHSESEDESSPIKKRNPGPLSKTREKAIANIFGFSHGSRRRTISQKNRHASQRYRYTSRTVTKHIESGSSDDYTTESDSEEMAAPRARRSLSMIRYAKPPSYDILEHPGGGLFVVGRKKIYPIIMNDNGHLDYALSGHKSKGVGDSYWKEKYMEEKKKCVEEKLRADELSRLLQRSQNSEEAEVPKSPILQANQSISSVTSANQKRQAIVKEPPQEKPEPVQKETVKIHLTVNNVGMDVEGQWPHINPVLERMVDMLKTNNAENKVNNTKPNEETPKDIPIDNKEPKQNTAKKIVTGKGKVENEMKKSVEAVEVSSGVSTPVVNAVVDPEVHEKVNQIESEIFKKIEEIDKSEQNIDEVNSDVNVTKRKRGRPRKTASTSSPVPPLESDAKVEKKPTKAKANKTNLMETESSASTSSFRRASKIPRRYESDSAIDNYAQPKLRRAASKLSLNNERTKLEVSIPEDDPSVRYMLPPPNKTRQNNANSYSDHETRQLSPDSSSRHSESTQGYQDSDLSPPTKIVRKKKRMSGATLLRKTRRKSSPYLADEDSYERIDKQPKTNSITNLSLSSEAYRSESYQMLLPRQKNFTQLDKIDENPISNGNSPNNVVAMGPLTVDTKEVYITSHDYRTQMSSEGNSSNFSLSLSPELSVVESLSVSREMIGSVHGHHPTRNESQSNEIIADNNPNKYLLSLMDLSVPLMGQDCELRNKQKNTVSRKRMSISEYLQNDVPEIEIEQSTSINQQLRELILESAKKMARNENENLPNIEVNMDIDPTASVVKKAKAKKRCSTPLKRKSARFSSTPAIDPVLEEHTETCSYGGRKSCPPVINIINSETIIDKNSIAEGATTKTVGLRKKKDVIKVKILRPRDKSGTRQRTRSASRLSVCTDSGINDTVSGLSDPDCHCCESTELIHNHSDTCLNMDDCVGDSVEIIDNTPSIISINSNSGNFEASFSKVDMNGDVKTMDLFCSNALDATSLIQEATKTQEPDVEVTVYKSPNPSDGSYNSLLTEDLSDDAPTQHPTPWYILSEEDTNFADARSQDLSTKTYGSNLPQIFPITCAVPDLSTITEISKDNESAKVTFNTDVEETQSQSSCDI